MRFFPAKLNKYQYLTLSVIKDKRFWILRDLAAQSHLIFFKLGVCTLELGLGTDKFPPLPKRVF